jgi:hypothetical protein
MLSASSNVRSGLVLPPNTPWRRLRAGPRRAGDNAFPGPSYYIHRRNVAHGSLELLDPRIAGRIVGQVRHHELAAAPLRRDIAKDGLHLFD